MGLLQAQSTHPGHIALAGSHTQGKQIWSLRQLRSMFTY